VPLFAASPGAADLRGLQRLATSSGIQWSWFLPMEESSALSGFPQRARRIDTRLARALTHLRPNEGTSGSNVLAYRNLVRGWAYGLASGTAIAGTAGMHKLGVVPVPIRPGTDIDALWYYVLREAEEHGATALGPLGSIIVCGTIAMILLADPTSYVNGKPPWTPDTDPLLRAGRDNRDGEVVGGARTWTLASIIRLAGLPPDLTEFQRQADDGLFPDPSA
jgi:hypothetical protein